MMKHNIELGQSLVSQEYMHARAERGIVIGALNKKDSIGGIANINLNLDYQKNLDDFLRALEPLEKIDKIFVVSGNNWVMPVNGPCSGKTPGNYFLDYILKQFPENFVEDHTKGLYVRNLVIFPALPFTLVSYY